MFDGAFGTCVRSSTHCDTGRFPPDGSESHRGGAAQTRRYDSVMREVDTLGSDMTDSSRRPRMSLRQSLAGDQLIRAAMSTRRAEYPHSLSYQETTFTTLSLRIIVESESTIDE